MSENITIIEEDLMAFSDDDEFGEMTGIVVAGVSKPDHATSKKKPKSKDWNETLSEWKKKRALIAMRVIACLARWHH